MKRKIRSTHLSIYYCYCLPDYLALTHYLNLLYTIFLQDVVSVVIKPTKIKAYFLQNIITRQQTERKDRYHLLVRLTVLYTMSYVTVPVERGVGWV